MCTNLSVSGKYFLRMLKNYRINNLKLPDIDKVIQKQSELYLFKICELKRVHTYMTNRFRFNFNQELKFIYTSCFEQILRCRCLKGTSLLLTVIYVVFKFQNKILQIMKELISVLGVIHRFVGNCNHSKSQYFYHGPLDNSNLLVQLPVDI